MAAAGTMRVRKNASAPDATTAAKLRAVETTSSSDSANNVRTTTR